MCCRCIRSATEPDDTDSQLCLIGPPFPVLYPYYRFCSHQNAILACESPQESVGNRVLHPVTSVSVTIGSNLSHSRLVLHGCRSLSRFASVILWKSMCNPEDATHQQAFSRQTPAVPFQAAEPIKMQRTNGQDPADRLERKSTAFLVAEPLVESRRRESRQSERFRPSLRRRRISSRDSPLSSCSSLSRCPVVNVYLFY